MLLFCLVYAMQWVEGMQDAGVNHYTFHLEATEDVSGCIRKIREAGMQVCIINPTKYHLTLFKERF